MYCRIISWCGSVSSFTSLRLVLAIADLEGTVGRLIAATRRPEEVEHLGVGGDVNVSVAYPRGELDCLGAEAGDQDRGWLVGQGVDPGLFYAIVFAFVTLRTALPEEPYDLYRLLQHLQAHVRGRP